MNCKDIFLSIVHPTGATMPLGIAGITSRPSSISSGPPLTPIRHRTRRSSVLLADYRRRVDDAKALLDGTANSLAGACKLTGGEDRGDRRDDGDRERGGGGGQVGGTKTNETPRKDGGTLTRNLDQVVRGD